MASFRFLPQRRRLPAGRSVDGGRRWSRLPPSSMAASLPLLTVVTLLLLRLWNDASRLRTNVDVTTVTTSTTTYRAVGYDTDVNNRNTTMSSLHHETINVGNASSSSSSSSESPPSDDRTHAGARFSNGTLGYVANVTRIRTRRRRALQEQRQRRHNDTSSFSCLPDDEVRSVCDDGPPPGHGPEQEEGWKVLTRVVQIVDNDVATSVGNNNNVSRVLCVVYSRAERRPQLRAVVDTWGWRCDGFFVASTRLDETLNAVDLAHNGPEDYSNMWQKTRSILAYMYDNYFDDFDFFFLCGDDTHVIVENLNALLSSMGDVAVRYPLYLGSWFQSPAILPRRACFYIVHGGGGYVLNRVTLKLLVVDLADCFAGRRSSSEDRFVAQCLDRVGIRGNSSVDDEGRQRFHPEDVQFVATFDGRRDDSARLRRSADDGSSSSVGFYGRSYRLWADHTGGFRAAQNLTSPSSVSFHRLSTPEAMKRHHAILYRSCPAGTVLGDALVS